MEFPEKSGGQYSQVSVHVLVGHLAYRCGSPLPRDRHKEADQARGCKMLALVLGLILLREEHAQWLQLEEVVRGTRMGHHAQH